jgi:hypothetical protein
MNNRKILEESAKNKSLYKFFKDNNFLTSDNIKLKFNYSKGKKSQWSLAFAGQCLKDVFGIENPIFCSKFVEAISGDGQEANKITTLHSSSLASLLVFYSVSKNNPIYVDVNGHLEKFIESRFEVKNEVSLGSNSFSNIDVVLYGDNCILYLESKFSEYLGSGPVEVKEVKYYDLIYNRLANTLSDIGLHLKERKNGEERVLERVDEKPFYSEGIKQMISHYLGLTTEIQSGRLNSDGKTIVLGEILFYFDDRIPNGRKKFNSYREAYSILKKGLTLCAEEDKTGLIINHLSTYQSILAVTKNHGFLMKLPESIREFYHFKELEE